MPGPSTLAPTNSLPIIGRSCKTMSMAFWSIFKCLITSIARAISNKHRSRAWSTAESRRTTTELPSSIQVEDSRKISKDNYPAPRPRCRAWPLREGLVSNFLKKLDHLTWSEKVILPQLSSTTRIAPQRESTSILRLEMLLALSAICLLFAE